MPLDLSSQHRAAPVLAVVVCYYPNLQAVVALVERLLSAGRADVLLIDNTESPEACAQLRRAVEGLDVELKCRGTNFGVADAHNYGLRRARQRGNEAVLLLDQDTVVQEDTLDRLLEAYRQLKNRGERVAGVGAAFVDPRNGFAFPFVRLSRVRMKRIDTRAGSPVPCDLLISSGSLIPIEAVDAVGEMDESLFIDYVDMEWCARARALGWKVFGVPAARMQHTIGDRTMRILGRVIAVHAPQRQYYLIRNALLFARKPYLPVNWRVHLGYRAVTQFVLFGLLCAPRLPRLHWLARGLWDGVRGRSGRLGGPQGLLGSASKPRVAATRESAVESSQSELVK